MRSARCSTGSSLQHDVILSEAHPGADCATASFASVTGREEDLVAQQARLADLTVVPHPDAGEDVSSSDALHAVLFDSGRPVLISPQTAPTTIGARVCLGWNGTAESASAVYAALPWLQRAEAVRILSAEGYQRRGPAAPDLAAYLALHGVHADIVMFQSVESRLAPACSPQHATSAATCWRWAPIHTPACANSSLAASRAMYWSVPGCR